MKVNVLFFSVLRDIVGQGSREWTIESDSVDVASLLQEVYGTYEGLSEWDGRLLIAVNCEYADRDQKLADGDEVALMPPVQGG